MLLGGCDHANRTDTESYQAAQELQRKGDLKGAFVELKNALQKNPNNIDARLLLAEVFLQNEQGIEAEIEYKRAMTLGVEYRRVAAPLARALFIQGDFSRLLNEVRPEEVDDESTAMQLTELRGEAELTLGQKQNAARSFAQVLARQPSNSDALVGQAQIALLDRNPGSAENLVEQVLRTDPDYLNALLLKAELQRARGRSEDARATYQAVLAHHPRNATALADGAYLDIAAGRFPEAEKAIAILKGGKATLASSLYLQALLDFRNRKYPAAREEVQKAVAANPNHLPTLMLAGVVEFSMGAYDQSERILRQVVSAAPGTMYAREILIAALMRQHRSQQAVEFLQPLLTADLADPAILALAGDVYAQNREYTKSTAYFAKAAQYDTQSSDAKLKLGVSRLVSGQVDQGLADLQKAVDLDPEQFQADTVLILSRMRRGEFAEAMSAVQKLEVKQPRNPFTYNLKAGILFNMKDFAGGRAALEKALQLEPKFVPALINLSRLDVKDGHPDLAIKRFDAFLANDPNNVEALMEYAALLQETGGKTADALVYLERARNADPKSIQARVQIAQLVMRTDPARAVAVANEALAMAPDNVTVLDTLGLAQIAANEQSGATVTYNKLIQMNPDMAVGYYRLATLSMAAGNDNAATRLLQKALELQPDFIEAKILFVNAATRNGNYADALAVAEKLQKQSPKLSAGYTLEGDVLMAQAKYGQAALVYDKAAQIDKNSLIVMKVFAAYSAAGRAADADAVASRFLSTNPDDGTARLYFANTALRKKQFVKAIEQYQALVEKEPDNVIALNDLAWAYGQVKDKRALETAARAYKLRPRDAHVVDTYGSLLVDAGQLPRAIEVMKGGLAAAQDSVELRFHLAQAYVKVGDNASARPHFEYVASARGNVNAVRKREAVAALDAMEQP